MPANANNVRLTAYIGAAVIFFGLLAFLFFAFPDSKLTSPDDAKKNSSANGSTRSSLSKYSSGGGGKKISDSPETVEVEEEDDSSLPGEVIIRAGSKEELARIFTSALENGGEFKGIIKELMTARIVFPTRSAAKKFRDSLGSDFSDSNYVVMAPNLPQDDQLQGAPVDGGNQPGRNTSTESLKKFGDSALEFLGITEDNSQWGKDLVVAILDSGVYAHESLSGINIKQIDLVQIAQADGQTTDGEASGYTGHGTGVAHITHMVAPIADILSVRVLDSEGMGDTFTVAQGIVAAADNQANVINLSLGSYGDSIVLRDAINYAVDKGVAVVAASGNDGFDQVSYPAAYENVIGVSAVDANGDFANFSNTGEGVDISAPGVGVYTAWDEAGAAEFSGTSAAAPFVSAAILAEMTRNPGYTIGQAAAAVTQSATDTGAAGRDPQTGNGILNLAE